jgi:lysophospholipase L1-like esterase
MIIKHNQNKKYISKMKNLFKSFSYYAFNKLILLIVFSSISLIAQDDSQISLSSKRILFLGDSITQDGTYVSYIDYFLQKMFPDKNFDIISIGLSSETASGLSEPNHPYPRPCIHERLERALEKTKPGLVIACYGMNDGIYYPQSEERFQAYKEGMNKLIKVIKSHNADLIILTPTIFDPVQCTDKIQKKDTTVYGYSHPYYLYDNVLADYNTWIMNDIDGDVKTIDLHSPMKKFLELKREQDSTFTITKDGVHPTHLGHLLMAEAFLKGVGVPLDFSDLNKELKKVEADTLFKLVDEQRQTRSNGWLDYVGYTRGKTVKTNNIEPTELHVKKLQMQIDELRRENKN